MRDHCQSAISVAGPLLLRPVPIKLHSVPVWVGQIDRFANAVVRRAFKGDACLQHAAQGLGQFRPRRIQDGDVVQSGRAGWRRSASGAFPRVQPDVMMVTTGGQERCLRPEPLSDFKAKHVAVEAKRPFQVRYFQMNVSDPDLWVDWMSL